LQNQTLQNEILKTRIYYGIAFFALVIGIIILLFFLRSRRKQKEFQHMLKDLELTILKSQLNPHFISNALSNIKTFIDNQPEKASQFLTKFARLMRRVLELNEEKLIPLNEELETIELYMQIEAIRLRFGFDYKIEIEDEVNEEMTMVPPLILQPAIENAIWHGLSQKPEKGYIHIKIGIEKEHLKIKIEDNGVGESEDYQNELEDSKAKGRKSFGVNITRKRIEILSDSPEKKGDFELKFLKDCTIAEITLPVFY
jgi:LytS/YehU family sensor histidine kinase